MEYRRFGDRIAVRMDRGDEVCAKLLELAEKENIRLASVTGIGASNDVTLGVFNTADKKYSKLRYNDSDYEIASITGNLSRQEGKPYLHLHAAIGNPVRGETHAGHLNAAVISATAEIMVGVVDGEVGRKFSDEIGLNLFEF
jgi:predicted DNA-binding protein with PD1-like motif